jgi:hypothetical protein
MANTSRREFFRTATAGLLASQINKLPVTSGALDSTFDLRVSFGGLCLFVPDMTTHQMHVVMPPTGFRNGYGDTGTSTSRATSLRRCLRTPGRATHIGKTCHDAAGRCGARHRCIGTRES